MANYLKTPDSVNSIPCNRVGTIPTDIGYGVWIWTDGDTSLSKSGSEGPGVYDFDFAASFNVFEGRTVTVTASITNGVPGAPKLITFSGDISGSDGGSGASVFVTDSPSFSERACPYFIGVQFQWQDAADWQVSVSIS